MSLQKQELKRKPRKVILNKILDAEALKEIRDFSPDRRKNKGYFFAYPPFQRQKGVV